MRKQHLIIAIALCTAMLALTSCKKETTEDVSKEVKVSFPEIVLKGEEIVVLHTGDTYTELGATLTDDITGQTSDIGPTSGTVNTSEAGLYVIEYSASNANGF